MAKSFYVTTAIAYVNAKPHMGHAMEFIEEDAIARFHRLIGDDTYALTGTDEHGMKIVQTAKKAGMEIRELVDQNAEKYAALKDTLNLSYDRFIRTSDQEKHWPSVIRMWKALQDKGDIYKASYEGYYCVGCESFVAQSDLADGKCPIHTTEPERIKEENYFFRLSKYADQIIAEIESGTFAIEPRFRANEIINILKTSSEEKKDVSFSRPRSVLSWGVPVPGDDSQVMYVWCDALTNYISALDYAHDGPLFQKYWAQGDRIVQIIGKDILRFHAGIWPAMLMSAGICRPTTLLVHGFVNMGGEKMSKSKGNVVDPLALIEERGIDPLRWYLLREIPMGQDGDFTHERFSDVYTADFANTIGNLVQRVCTMALKDSVKLVPMEMQYKNYIDDRWKAYCVAFDNFRLHDACKEAKDLAGYVNMIIDQEKPWKLAKENDARFVPVLSNFVGLIRALSVLLYPIIPGTSDKIRARLGLGPIDDRHFDINAELTAGTEGVSVQQGEPLFPRIS